MNEEYKEPKHIKTKKKKRSKKKKKTDESIKLDNPNTTQLTDKLTDINKPTPEQTPEMDKNFNDNDSANPLLQKAPEMTKGLMIKTENSQSETKPRPRQIQRNYPQSPRKQSIMRYKKSDEAMNHDFMNELKGNLKSNDVDKTSIKPPIHTDEKISLFRCKSSKILVFDEDIDGKEDLNTSGRLLGHGQFEVFQLHNGDVTYLSCGQTFIYPLLPKLKILRIAFNQFILPLVNPERYWKIFITTEDPGVIENLERTLEKVVRYRNLAVGVAPVKGAGIESPLAGPSLSIDAAGIITPQKHGDNWLPNEIPESPPSAPLSPHQNTQVISNHQVFKPLSSELPNFYSTRPQVPFTVDDIMVLSPIPNRSLVKTKDFDNKSDSSMDSLLDEYEEQMSVSKSFTYSKSRPMSRSSSFVQPAPIYKRLENFGHDEFPSTSLSEYNKAHNVKSRRSSRSELYASESNWMEPTIPVHKPIPNSRSTYSLHSLNNDRSRDLNSTYKQIYKSITQRDIALILNDKNEDARSVRSVRSQRLPTIQQSKPLTVEGPGLNTEKVYKMLHEKRSKPAVESKGFASRLFGW